MKRGTLLVLALLSGAGCREKRRPIDRGDAGPAVVVMDRRDPDLGLAPANPEHEPNDVAKQAQLLEADQRGGGTIPLVQGGAKPDVDWYAVGAPQAATDLGPSPDLAGTDAGAPPPQIAFLTLSAAEGPLRLELVDAKGKVLLSRIAPAHGRAQISHLRLDGGGSALLRVRRPPGLKTPATSASDYTIEYSTRLAMLDEELEPNDDPAHAGALSAAGTLSGRLDGDSDRDLVALPALADGATYRVELAGLPELATELRLRDGDTVLATARGGKGSELRLRNLPGQGKGALSLALRAVDGSSELPYALRVSTEPALDAAVEHEPNDERARATQVVAGEISGYLWPGDVDWFCRSDEGGLGARIEAMPDVDWKLEAFDAAGKSLKKADVGKRGTAEEIAAEAAVRCVRLSARSRDTAYDAPYRLTVTFAP